MTLPQKLYLVAVGIYALLFLMFSRFFIWKRYSENRYWNRRPKVSLKQLHSSVKASGGSIPRFSILVPAREEAAVIDRTLRHMSELHYPSNAYEIIVVTDEKESISKKATSKRVSFEVSSLIMQAVKGEAIKLTQEQGELVLSMLAEIAISEYRNCDPEDSFWVQPLELAHDDEGLCKSVLEDIVRDAIPGHSNLRVNRGYCILRRAFPGYSDDLIARLYPGYLCLALPIVSAYCSLTGMEQRKTYSRFVKYIAKNNRRYTRDLVAGFASTMDKKITTQVTSVAEGGQMAELCNELHRRAFPTTQAVVERVIQGKDPLSPKITHVEVPYDFDGLYQGKCTGHEVTSTKGRALNYALSFVTDQTDVCGFYDAESRPHPDVLLYIAHKRLQEKSTVSIWQGPVFQVRNFYEMGPFSKIASLYQAVAHDWYLPVVFRRLPFVGGTNLFIDAPLIKELGGYDNESLTEDLELGTRAYLDKDSWPDYLPYPSSEQTPPSFMAFFRQRLRWGTGHLQVMSKIRRQKNIAPAKKARLMRRLLIKGPLEWSFYQAMTLLPPTFLILYWLNMIDNSIAHPAVRVMLNMLSLVYIGFTFYAFSRYKAHLDNTSRPLTLAGNILVGSQLFFLPLAAFFFPVPYTSAMVLRMLNRHPTTWTKTPRTRE